MDLEGFNDLVTPKNIDIPKRFSFHEVLDDVDKLWFVRAARSARWMDLLGDYAGNEPFLIDGEALLHSVLEDPLLSIGREGCSFQILHGYHIIENLLGAFKQRSANFEIAFWQTQRHFVVKTGSTNFEVASRLLARSMLFRHLLTLEFKISIFNGLSDPVWSQYAAKNKPMFVMTHDGGLCKTDSNDIEAAYILSQRIFILEILSNSGGVAVALLNGAEYRDSKILSFVHEPTMYNDHSLNLRDVSQDVYNKLQQHLSRSLDNASSYALSMTPHMNGVEPTLCTTCAHDQNLDNIAANVCRDLDIMSFIGKGLPAELVYLFLVHVLLVPSLSVQERAQVHPHLNPKLTELIRGQFIPILFSRAANLLATHAYPLDLDGSIFTTLIVVALLVPNHLLDYIGKTLHREAEVVWSILRGPPLDFEGFSAMYPLPGKRESYLHLQHKASETSKLLEFSNPVFDDLFFDLQLPTHIVDSDLPSSKFEEGVFFSDNRHWHSRRSILASHEGGSTTSKPLDAWGMKRKLRADQRFMSVMQKQAASLTGASGAILQQAVISAVGQPKLPQQERRLASGSYPKKKAPVLSSADKLKLSIKDEKESKNKSVFELKWKQHLSDISKLSRSQKLASLDTFSRNKKIDVPIVILDMQLFRINLEIEAWLEEPTKDQDTSPARDRYTVSIMRIVKDISDSQMMTHSARKVLTSVLDALGFHGYAHAMFSGSVYLEDQPLSFSFVKLVKSKTNTPLHRFMAITEHPVEWQLRLFGQYMDRSMDGSPDERVSFKPDAWQKKVLDGIDRKTSLLIVAPTSAGKTFISFYAMEKVLRELDTGILVYIAPTKALVTQIAAEVYARFSKTLNGRSCWAIHTRDYRIHDPQTCQILVTVPEMLAIMLFSPPLARKWVPRVKRIILDEIHSFGQQDGGAVWEQIILLAPCPIIGLSATIGSPGTFSDWLASVQRAHGFDYEFIEHHNRYSHLRKFFYHIDGEGTFSSLDDHKPTDRARFLHPIALLSFGPRGLPSDLSLEAADNLTLFKALRTVQRDVEFDMGFLNPQTFFSFFSSALLRQKDVLLYETKLKSVLIDLMSRFDPRDISNPLGRVIRSLQDPVVYGHSGADLDMMPSPQAFKNDLLVLLSDLHVKNELPAILFNFDRTSCEVMAQHLVKILEKAESGWRSTNPHWTRKIYEWENWKAQSKARERANERDQRRKVGIGRQENSRDTADPSWQSSFDPEDPSPGFSFAGIHTSYSHSQLKEDIRQLSWTSLPSWVFDALRRGIAIHHAGMFKHYRSLVESLFRQGFVRVIIATGTLALGINAPTKTSVFCGDSPFLTALMYRQCAGRAGRRGFDLLGNVIFYGLPLDRVQRLILSRLPTLGGTFPLTPTTILRLFSLLDGSDNSDFAVRAIRDLMSLPHITMSSSIGRDQLLHHLRFGIEYLRRSRLLDKSGKPINLYAIAAHLYYNEPENLALVLLMRSGVLHEICSEEDTNIAKRNLMITLCNLFGRRYLSKVFAKESNIEVLKSKYPSMIILPPLPASAQTTLEKHNEEILSIFKGYATAFAMQYKDKIGTDNTLPLSGKCFCGDSNGPVSSFRNLLRRNSIPVVVRSAFASNSGHDDSFKTVAELMNSSRTGLNLNGHGIPSMSHLTVNTGQATMEHQLNAYILDFYIHGQVKTLADANCIRRGDTWFLLQDFCLTLKTMKSGLEQLMLALSEAASKASPEEYSDSPSLLCDTVGIEVMEGDLDEESEIVTDKEKFKRPKNIKSVDWRVYNVVSDTCNEFEEKFRAMWA